MSLDNSGSELVGRSGGKERADLRFELDQGKKIKVRMSLLRFDG